MKIIKQQSKLTFNGIHKWYESGDSYTFKQNEFLMDKPIYLGFTVLELSKLHMYETYYDKIQPYFGQENLHLLYMDTDSFILSVNTGDFIKDLKNFGDIFDFSLLDKSHDLFTNKNKEVIVYFIIETPKNIRIDKFVCLRSKVYAFKCGDISKNKVKGLSKSQSKHIKFEDYRKKLDGEEYQILYLIQHNFVISRLCSVQISIWHQSQGTDTLTKKLATKNS